MNKTMIMPVRPGTLDAYDKSELRKAGVVVVEHECPEELRLLFLEPMANSIDGSMILLAAMKALKCNSGVHGTDQRDMFAKLMSEYIEQALGKK